MNSSSIDWKQIRQNQLLNAELQRVDTTPLTLEDINNLTPEKRTRLEKSYLDYLENAFKTTGDSYDELLTRLRTEIELAYQWLYKIDTHRYKTEIKIAGVSVSKIEVLETIGQDPKRFVKMFDLKVGVTWNLWGDSTEGTKPIPLSHYFNEGISIDLDPQKVYKVKMCEYIGYLYPHYPQQSLEDYCWVFLKTDKKLW